MNKEKEVREALYKIREGVDLLINTIGRECADIKPENTEVAKNVKADVPTEPTVNNKAAKPVEASFDAEDLSSMAYNDLKKLAKDLGVSGAGSREKIIERILGVDLTVREDGEVEVADEKPVAGNVPKKPLSKLGKKKEEVPEEDPLYEQVVEATEGMSIEELGDILSDIGKSPKGKREALIDKIYKAVKDGELSFDDEDEDDDTEAEDEPVETEGEVADTDEDDEYEDDGVNDPDNMTDARKEACEDYANEIKNDFDNGDLSVDDMREFCIEFYGEENADAINDYSDEEVLELYIDAAKRMINDEGELVEEGAYTVNGEYFCCGRPLQYAEDTNKYICEMCGAEYDAE